MRNIHVISTDKPSRLAYYQESTSYNKPILQIVKFESSDYKYKNIYITNDEKPKAGEWSLYQNKIHKCIEDIVGDEFKKIILTTDPQLIADGVQPIDDEFLEWFVKNPSCEEVEVENIPNNSWGFDLEEPMNLGYKIIIPSEEPKQETFNSKRGLKELQLKDPNTCEYYKEVGCVKDVCDCYTLVSKEEPSTRLKNSLKQFNISLEEALGMEDFRLKNIGFSKRSILEIDLFRGEPKQETLEKYYLGNIKNVLQFGNDAQAIRLMEKYYHAKKQQDGK